MAGYSELEKLVDELRKTTGLQVEITTDDAEDIEHAKQQLRQLLGAYKEKYDKNYFLRNLMLGKMQNTEVDSYAKKFHISNETKRVLFLVETKTGVDDFFIELLRNLFPAKNKNEIVKMDHPRVVLLWPTEADGEALYEASMQTAHMIVDTVSAEEMSSVRVSFSEAIGELADMAKCYSDVSMAMKIGHIFYSEQTVIPYNRLGTGGLIYRVPRENCEEFLREVFCGEVPERLDEEMKMTVSKFFQYNLNISETSRQLHMHRNTLIYRIEQLQKRTGLDIRVFEDACVFRIAMMVMNDLKAEE